jgi:hypothetical protein
MRTYACTDVAYIEPTLEAGCNRAITILNGSQQTEPTETACQNIESATERSQCEGSLEGLNFASCTHSDPLRQKTCELFQKALVKNCAAEDSECKNIEKFIHSYTDCGATDYFPICVGYQVSYLEGISSAWLNEKFMPQAKAQNPVAKEDNTRALAYINPKRLDSLNMPSEDLEFLINNYPTLSRSVLLNTHFSKKFETKEEIWNEIEDHLYPNQTVGFELECPAVTLDITSGHNPPLLKDLLTQGGYGIAGSFEDVISEQEKQNKKLNIDAGFEANNQHNLAMLSFYGFWKDKGEFPFFDTYGQSLFESKNTHMNLPLLNVTLESRYSYDHFPHIELVTAPLHQSGTSLNFYNTAYYMSRMVRSLCDNKDPMNVQFTNISTWKDNVDQIPYNAYEDTLSFDYTAAPYLAKVPMICNSSKLRNCHVQSNVGVYFDQFFTDSFLLQTIGSNSPYDTDAVYHAAWSVAKKAFSMHQWEAVSDTLVDARNHAAGIFTYAIYEMFLKSILYAGKFDFWKGTLSHLMKFELRSVWKELQEDEKALFKKAVHSLWTQEKLPQELDSLIERVFRSFLYNAKYGDDPSLPAGKPEYSKEFAETVHAIFKELIWNVALSDDQTYYQSLYYSWGSVVSERQDMLYYDKTKDEYVQRSGFVFGCSYADHNGSQCDIAKVIKPVSVPILIGNKNYTRNYVVVETRYGNADFNNAVFWRCHEQSARTHPDMLQHRCQ